MDKRQHADFHSRQPVSQVLLGDAQAQRVLATAVEGWAQA